jgi:hypothetical protein
MHKTLGSISSAARQQATTTIKKELLHPWRAGIHEDSWLPVFTED